MRAQDSPGVGDLKHDIARTQDALEAVHGTLGHVVDRLAMIENDIRGETRPHGAPDDERHAAVSRPTRSRRHPLHRCRRHFRRLP